MQSIDAKEAVDNDPDRYHLEGYSKQSEEPQQRIPTRPKPIQTIPSSVTAESRVEMADLSKTSGAPDKPINEARKERMVKELEETSNPANVPDDIDKKSGATLGPAEKTAKQRKEEGEGPPRRLGEDQPHRFGIDEEPMPVKRKSGRPPKKS